MSRFEPRDGNSSRDGIHPEMPRNLPSCDNTLDLSGLIARTRGIQKWLKRAHPSCFANQEHLNEGSKERAYWHYGYMVALNDALKLLTGDGPLSHDTPELGTSSACSSVLPDG